MNPQRRKRIIIGIGAFLVIASLIVYVHGVHRMDPRALDRLIQQELPLGIDKDSVLAFLDAHRIPHTPYMVETRKIQGQMGRSAVGLKRARIYIDFNFDENGKLINHDVQEMFEWF